MSEQHSEKILEVLAEIRDTQRTILDLQNESIAMRKEEFNMAKSQFERAERIHERSEQMQGRNTELVTSVRKFMKFFLPIAGLLLVYLTWVAFFRI